MHQLARVVCLSTWRLKDHLFAVAVSTLLILAAAEVLRLWEIARQRPTFTACGVCSMSCSAMGRRSKSVPASDLGGCLGSF